MPSFLEICLNKRIILTLTLGLQLRYLTSSFLSQISLYIENGHVMSIFCQVVKTSSVLFPWTLNIEYNNIYSDDHEHDNILYTFFSLFSNENS